MAAEAIRRSPKRKEFQRKLGVNMRNDLRDAYAAIDWAVAHLPALQSRIEAWAGRNPYTFVPENHPETGKKFFKLRVDWEVPLLINAEVGVMINSIRTSLDLLAASFAIRNGKQPTPECHFPIYRSHQEFIDPLNAAKRKKWFRERERAVIERLKPYRGGDDELFALHRLDIMRKHTRLIKIEPAIDAISISPGAYAQGMEFPNVWPGFKDGAIVAWTNINATECDFHITHSIAFSESDTSISGAVWPVIRRLATLAAFIVENFEQE